MDVIRRVCIILGLLPLVLVFPSRAWSAKIDPYAFTTIIGTVFFEYEHDKRTEQESNFVEKTSAFTQDYGLSARGPLYSRILATYDASFTYERQTFNTNFTDNTTNSFFFDIRTQLLPLSRIPLTLFATRNKSTVSSGAADTTTDTTYTTYGLNWTGKFQVLPVMNLNVTRNVQDTANGGSNKDTRIYFTADKEYGPMLNSLRYTGTFRDNTGGSSDSSTNIGFSNITRLSRHSSFTLGLTRDVTDTPDTGTTKTFGLTMAVTSQPSRFFDQTHNLTYYRTDGQDSSFNGTTYSGSLRYKITRKLSSNLAMSVSRVFSETQTSSDDSTSTNVSGNIAYKLTDHLTTTQSVSLSFTESDASNPGQRNLSDRKTLNYTGNVSYNRSFSRFNFFTRYGLGYISDTDLNINLPDNGGQAITHEGSAGLSRIDFNRLFFFDLSYDFRRVLKTTSGTVNENHSRYKARFYNRFWRKYLNINGGFQKYNQKIAVQAIEEKSETYDITMSAHPVRGSLISLNLQRLLYFTDFVGFSQTNSGVVTAAYSHKLLGGNLGANATYSLFDRTFTDGSDITRTLSYELTYERVLLRRVMWKFSGTRSETKIEEFFSRYTTISNTAFYRLRAWSFSLEHSYSIEEDSARQQRDNRILFKAGRQFIRMF